MSNPQAIQVIADLLRRTPMNNAELLAAEIALQQLNELVQADAKAQEKATTTESKPE